MSARAPEVVRQCAVILEAIATLNTLQAEVDAENVDRTANYIAGSSLVSENIFWSTFFAHASILPTSMVDPIRAIRCTATMLVKKKDARKNNAAAAAAAEARAEARMLADAAARQPENAHLVLWAAEAQLPPNEPQAQPTEYVASGCMARGGALLGRRPANGQGS